MMAVAWGNKSVKFRGALAIVVVVLFCIVASIITTIVYIGGRVETTTKEAAAASAAAVQSNTLVMKEIAQRSEQDHKALLQAMDRGACINSFEIKDRREVVANERLMRASCWWMDDRR